MDTKSAIAIIILSAILVTSGCTSSSLNGNGNGGTKKGIDWDVEPQDGSWLVTLNYVLDYPEGADLTWKLGGETDRGSHAEFTTDPEACGVHLTIEMDEETKTKTITIPASEFISIEIPESNVVIKDKYWNWDRPGSAHQTVLNFQIRNKGVDLDGVTVNVDVIEYGDCGSDSHSHSENYVSIGQGGTVVYKYDDFCDQKDGKEISFNVNIRSDQGDSSRTISCTADTGSCSVSS